MEHHFVRNTIRHSKRHSNMNELFLSPSLHHRKRPRLFKQEAFNQNNQRLQIKNIYSSSYTSLNSYLKEFNLSEKDFFELRQALKTIFYYLKPIYNDKQLLKQRLTSPYLQQQQLNNDDQSSLPLYTNEYFIRNGLLNHNDGPEIYDNIFQSRNLCYSHHSKPIIHFKSSLSSSVNISLPLALLSNQKYLFNALTSNFTSEKSRRSRSNMGLNMFQYYRKGNDNESETKSMMIRRNKVKIWERENILQQNDQINASEYQRSSIVRTPLTNKNEKIVKIHEEFITENNISLRTYNKEEENDKTLKIKNIDDLFPMVKILAPYIIIRDSFHVNSNNEKSIEHVNTMNETRQTNNKEQVQQRKTNYLLAEFESVLTQISKK